MFSPWLVLLAILLFTGALFVIALWSERHAVRGKRWVGNPYVYSLALAIYCTSWTFYGSVGKAASSGWIFLTVYLGPTLAIVLWWTIVRKMVRIKTTHHISSIADFISVRYDRSQTVAALATLTALLGITPYIAVQLRAVFTTFSMLTSDSAGHAPWNESVVGLVFIALMTVFTIVFGVRRLDPTERHPGVIVSLALMSVIKLVAFLAAGIFVTYVLYDGFGDIFNRLAANPNYRELASATGGANSNYLSWMTFLVLSMSAILFLPRQFHVTVVENSNEKHIRTAMWLFPLYMLLINLFVFPIAIGGLLKAPSVAPDYFVLGLPLEYGDSWLTLFIYIGGFAAALGMIIVSTMTLSTMFTNHLAVPVIERVERLSFLRRFLLQVKWLAVALLLLVSFGFERMVGSSYPLVSIGMISFAAALQFAPAILGGLFWRQGNKTGAILGLGAGFSLWFYTLLLPTFVGSGRLPSSLLTDGPLGIGFLNPQHLFGLQGFDSLSHGVFWTMFFNIGLYIIGSIAFTQSSEERDLADAFISVLERGARRLEAALGEAHIELALKRQAVEALLSRYFTTSRAIELTDICLTVTGLYAVEKANITQLMEFYGEVERHLAGAIGSAAAHDALQRAGLLTQEETQELSHAYSEILASLQVSPQDLQERIDYYKERETLLSGYAEELEQQVADRTAEVREREGLLRSVIDATPDWIFAKDRDYHYVLANRSYAEAFNTTPAVLIGKGDLELGFPTELGLGAPGNGHRGFRAEDQKVLENGEEIRNPNEPATTAKGQRLILDTFRTPLRNDQGETWAVLGVARDVTERVEMAKKMQGQNEQLVRSNRELAVARRLADEANKLKSQFLATMSHELRTPLNAIIGYADIVLAGMTGELTEEQLDFQQRILANAEHLLGLINDILDLAKIEAGRMEVSLEPFNLRDLLREITRQTEGLAANKGLAYESNLDPRLPPVLMGDAGRIKQITINLISNAVKFTDRGHVKVEFRQNGRDSWAISVTDTGIGISSTMQQTIFDEFRQLDSSSTRKHGGTGLGLAIVRRFALAMGGNVKVNSKVGEGSTFTVLLPLAEVTEPEEPLEGVLE